MIVYEAIKEDFLEDVFNDQLTNNIINNFNEKIGKVNEAEVRSWDNSMQYMYRVLMDENIPSDSGVAIEFNIPYSSKRVDFIISGMNKEKESVVIVELKQWEKVEKVVGKEAIVKTYLGGGIRETAHPSYQAWSYASLIKDYNENVQQDHIDLYPCAYLHNYITQKPEDDLTHEVYDYYIEDAPVFVKGDAKKLREFIKQHIKYGDNKETLYKIERGKIKPSKSLQDSLSLMLKGNEEFIMIDEQKVVFEEAMSLSKKTIETGEKQVLIVEGGPGTGKSVVGINLLVKLTNEELVVQYVTRNAAPRDVYEQKLKGDYRKSEITNLFKGSGSYIDTKKNEFDVLVVDEAHRLNEKTGMFKKGKHQVKEIINSSKLSVFFLDENQKIHIDDVGDIEVIKKYANELKAETTTLELTSQFRCNGSDGYLAWLDDVLQIRETANVNFIGKDYDFRIYDDPNEMRNEIERLNKGRNKSRIVSGYCWDWNKDTRFNSDIPDIVIPEYNFGMSWNLNNTATWAIDEDSVKESGVIHTCQGLEFDYVGVIIGDDLRYKNDKVITDHSKRAKGDRSLWGIKKMIKENPNQAEEIADQIIRNTYRTLMTRGQKGCFIFCTDKKLANYFKERLYMMRDYTKDEFFRTEDSVAENRSEYNLQNNKGSNDL